jgi:hypothetical protein
MYTIIDACANGGVKSGDKERVYTLIDSLKIKDVDVPTKPWNKFKIMKEITESKETGEITERFVPDFHVADAKEQRIMNESEDKVTYEEVQAFTSFRDYLDNWVEVDNGASTQGMNAILKKLDIATKWYTDKWGLHLYELRQEVGKRQNEINDWASGNVTYFDFQ